eukprot:CAMPEP_0171699242 /NCGR_PEP_ID=MMETSP0991-20121206/9843_1 /TAXON_ID=483369 /ORGANISM="non described non described, Strain CCMP2098" /LENGTH=410 /DNA_ID=CAMNT_0012288275 /DNA_START=23 /DNA_END=1255 /DNA_ORIENTATION=+
MNILMSYALTSTVVPPEIQWLSTLPTDILACMCEYLMCTELLRMELTERQQQQFLSSPRAFAIWELYCWNVWSTELRLGVHGSWRDAAINLERHIFPILCDVGVKPAMRALDFSRQSPSSLNSSTGFEFATKFTLGVLCNTLKYRAHLDCRRRVALFACSSGFAGAPPIDPHAIPGVVDNRGEAANLLPILKEFGVIGAARDPEEALRQLLLQFPFLPLDAGEGADRVIKTLGRVYLDTHPGEYDRLRKMDRCAEDCHDDAESAVYILIYAVIMLNTDLHNKQNRHKMTAREFVRSTRSTVLGSVYEEADLLRIYGSVASQPLRICALNVQRRLSNLLDVRTRHQAASTNFSIRTGDDGPGTMKRWVSALASPLFWGYKHYIAGLCSLSLFGVALAATATGGSCISHAPI